MPTDILETLANFIDGVLNSLGGYHCLFARRFIMPFLFSLVSTICICFIEHTLKHWWVFFLPLPAMGTLTLPYFSGSNWGRALWLFIQAIAFGLGLAIFGHLGFNHFGIYINNWEIFIGYIILAGILGGLYKNWQQILGDFITGSYLSILLFFVK